MAEKIVIEAEVKSNIGDVSKDAGSAAAEFRFMGVSLNGVKKGFTAMAITAKASFATIKAGMISTGIGALIVAVGSLLTYFNSTKRGADLMARAFTATGVIVSVLIDRISKFGEALSLVFSGKFSQAGDKLAATFKGITAEIVLEIVAMDKLKLRTLALRDADMEFMVQKAKTRQEIERARLIAEDETKSAQERLTNLKKALELEAETTKQEIELAKERVAVQREEMLLSENMVEDEEKLAELRTALIETETASIKMRRRVVTEVNALENEIRAEEKARTDAKLAEAALKIKALEDEKKAADKLYDSQIAQANAFEARAKKAADDEIQLNIDVRNAKQNSAKSGLKLLQSVAGEGAAIGKAAAIADVTISGVQGVQNAFSTASKSPITTVFPAYPFIQAGLAGAFSAITLQKIISGGGGGGGGGAGGGGAGAASAASAAPAPQMMSGAFDMTGGAAPEPIKAFVLTDEMSNSQNQLANIRRRATI
tara:strand:+ start:45 stop:1499 length:1455 start_codon:yes stop_codon:yes gene_type:complete